METLREDAMNQGAVSANIRRLRNERGLTQDAVANAAGISRLALRNIEKQKSQPRPDTLQAIARALSVGLGDLVVPVVQLKHVRFRSRKRLNSREQILADVARRLGDFNDLEEILKEKRGPVFATVSDGRRAGIDRAREAAKAVRKKFGVSEDEPVRDIAGLLEARGYKVLPVQIANDGFFGLSVATGDGGPAIVVNTQERISVERWIFSAAHELGHLLLHLDSYDVAKAAEEAEEEKEANVFASYFLMPEQLFVKEWEEARGLSLVNRVLKVKRMFRVSYRTILHRLIDQYPEHHSQDRTYVKFATEYKRATGRSLAGHAEPERLGPESFMAPEPLKGREPEELRACDFQEDKLSRLVRRGIEEGVISMSRAGEILGKSLTVMRELTMAWVA
jgi:Zn-dependent peptidase ImmA (M78 family)/transcriptional regulator with XRE-family HTH domain